VASIGAIISGGTRICDSSSFRMRPSLGTASDVQWSLNYQQTIKTSQSVLAEKLAFSEKAFWTMLVGWIACVGFVIGTIASLVYTNKLQAEGNNFGWTPDLSNSYHTYNNVGEFCFLAIFVTFFIALLLRTYIITDDLPRSNYGHNSSTAFGAMSFMCLVTLRSYAFHRAR